MLDGMEVKNQPKILYVITKSYFGGAQRYVYELAQATKASGFTVAVACGGKEELVTRLADSGILTFEIEGAQRDISLIKEIKALYSLSKIIRSYQPDVIHLNSSKIGLLGSLIARLLRVPNIIFTAHGWPFLEPTRKLYWRVMAWIGSYLTSLLAHQVILVSNNDLNHTKMPGLKNKFQVIHTSVRDFPLLERKESRLALLPEEIIKNHEQNIWVVTHGEINHNKNLSLAIDAVAEFNSSHTTKIFYVIIGSGDLMNSLKEQVDLKGLTDQVQFLGYKKDARQFLLAFDIYLIPSLKEGLPYSLLEAGLAGLPCIASRVGGIPEVISDHQSGILINPQNHMGIVEAFDFLLTNADKRSAYSNELAHKIKSHFSSELMFAKTLPLYTLGRTK
jgi:glycosyltransferase involved in cell wall biosynthesis